MAGADNTPENTDPTSGLTPMTPDDIQALLAQHGAAGAVQPPAGSEESDFAEAIRRGRQKALGLGTPVQPIAPQPPAAQPRRTPAEYSRPPIRRSAQQPPHRENRAGDNEQVTPPQATSGDPLMQLLVNRLLESKEPKDRTIRNLLVVTGIASVAIYGGSVATGLLPNPLNKNVAHAEQLAPHTTAAVSPSPTPELTPTPSDSITESPTGTPTTSPSPTESPSPTDTSLSVAPNHLFRPGALGCNTVLQVKVGGMVTDVALNYTFPAETAPAPSPSATKSSPVPKTTPPPKPPTVVGINEHVKYQGTLGITVCANDKTIETVDKDSPLTKQVIKVDESKLTFIVDPSKMTVSSDLTSLDTKSQQKLVQLFKQQGKTITATDIARISHFAQSQLPNMAIYSLNELGTIIDTLIDGENNGATYQSEVQQNTESVLTPLVITQANSQQIPTWAINGGQPQYINTLPSLAKAIAAVKAYQMPKTTAFVFNADSTQPGQLTISTQK